MADDTTKAIYQAIWDTDYDTDLAANGRCGSHRLAEQIAGALAAAGLLAAPAEQPAGRGLRDRNGDVWLEKVVSTRFLQLIVDAEGQRLVRGVPQSVEDVERKWGPLVPVAAEQPDASPATPADEPASPYEVGGRIRFTHSGNIYRVTAVDHEQSTVTFARHGDPEDASTETFQDLDGHVTVLP